ncbi:MAG: DUF971 domain-containing protein [Actinobacteria bacterium]|nr:DUF971 domain-containing protein [Actinomycetota bacterium]
MTTPPPQKVDVDPERLVVSWSDDHVGNYDLIELRRACLCAQCTQLREVGEAAWPRPGAPERLTVVGAELMGAWGLNLRWNDGHETGVYPWETMLAWCDCERCAARKRR